MAQTKSWARVQEGKAIQIVFNLENEGISLIYLLKNGQIEKMSMNSEDVHFLSKVLTDVDRVIQKRNVAEMMVELESQE